MRWPWSRWKQIDEEAIERRRQFEAQLAARAPGPHFLFRVEDLFTIRGRGIVLLPGGDGSVPFRLGEALELRLPDGTTRITTIRGVEGSHRAVWLPGHRPQKLAWSILVAPDVQKDDVPVGTEVWLIVEPSRPPPPSV